MLVAHVELCRLCLQGYSQTVATFCKRPSLLLKKHRINSIHVVGA